MNEIVKQSVIECVDHWKRDMVEPLKNGRTIIKHRDTIIKSNRSTILMKNGWLVWKDNPVEKVKCYAEHCSLCVVLKNVCSDCPLEHCGGVGVWAEFERNPCLETANGMVNKLESLLPKE